MFWGCLSWGCRWSLLLISMWELGGAAVGTPEGSLFQSVFWEESFCCKGPRYVRENMSVSWLFLWPRTALCLGA